MKNDFTKVFITWVLLLFPMIINAQLLVTPASELPGWNADDLVRNIFLNSGVTVTNVKFNGSMDTIYCNNIGIFDTGTAPTNLGIESGIIIATGNVNVAVGPNNNDGYHIPTNCDNYHDASLASIATSTTHDVAVLEFDFVPWDSVLKFNYVFGSEEYMEWVGHEYNDVFGFFVDGPNPAGGNYLSQNMALIPNTNDNVSINNVNLNHNSEYFVNNLGGTSIQFDGFTTVLEVRFNVVPLGNYHFKMAICDVNDSRLDSGVFLQSNSLSTNAAVLFVDDQPAMEHPEGFDYCRNDLVNFNVNLNFTPSNIIWDFGDGGSGSGIPTSHLYTNGAGDYEVLCNIYENVQGQDSLVLTLSTIIHLHDASPLFELWNASCDSYTLFGQNFTQSGDYEVHGQNIYGCDSTILLHLTIHHSDTTHLNITACEHYYWYGTNYTHSGVYEHLETNSFRCDSLIILHLTIDNHFIQEENVEACNSYYWRGHEYTHSGTFSDESPNPEGCDSTFILHLTIGQSYDISLNKTVCDAYSWPSAPDGVLTQSGSYNFTGQSIYGCDSIVNLDLVVNHSATTFLSDTVCEQYNWNGTNYTQSGVYEHLEHTSTDCDSLIILDLTVFYPYDQEEVIDTCDSYYWRRNEYTESGTYTDVSTNSAGCDSTFVLYLSIRQSYDINLNDAVCDFYPWASAPDGFLTQTGNYTYEGYSMYGCDSIVNLDLVVHQTPKLEIQGLTEVAVSTDLWSGIYNYCLADSTELQGCDIHWSCSNPDWIVLSTTDPIWCRLIAKSLGQATLTAVSDCEHGCNTSYSLVINASNFDVDENEAQKIVLFPNPTRGQVSIQAPQLRQVNFINNLGMVSKVLSFESTDMVSINVNDLAQGFYVVEIITAQGKTSKKLFVLE